LQISSIAFSSNVSPERGPGRHPAAAATRFGVFDGSGREKVEFESFERHAMRKMLGLGDSELQI
jgi:hypothetical protein